MNNAKIWGIPASYMNPSTGTRLTVEFGLDIYAPTRITGWGFINKMNSKMKFSDLWDNGDLALAPGGGFNISTYAQQVIIAQATDWASYQASRYIAWGWVNNSSEYKTIFMTSMRDFLAIYFPGSTVNPTSFSPIGKYLIDKKQTIILCFW